MILLTLCLATVRIEMSPVSVRADNGSLRLMLDRRSGEAELNFGDRARIAAIHGRAKIGDTLVDTTDYPEHAIETLAITDRFGRGRRIVVHHRGGNRPELRQTFSIYEGKAEVVIQLAILAKQEVSSNFLAPVVTDAPVTLAHRGPLNSLFVPWDNDSYFRFNSDGWGEGDGNGDGSYEVGAVYDDVSRSGLIVGSIDHDQWKSAVRFFRGGGMRAVAGVASKYTHDTQPHGSVHGRLISSPRMVVGQYADWRAGLERFADLNAIVRPPLGGQSHVPFAWNSWSGHKEKVSAADARAATDFVRDALPGFRSGGTAYINFDSFWDNLTPAELKEFVAHAHASGLKTGIYWTPFACWTSLDRPIERGSIYRFQDIVLRDSNGAPMPKLDGAYPIDPTHPVALAWIDRKLQSFVDMGYDYIKLDFLSHGALEGRHWDRNVATGTAAYNLGMQRIVRDLGPKRIGRPFFISLSIAPMFPHGYAHSRRISCDVFANIGASEYLLNSTNYGWWPGGRLYAFDDPDSATVWQARGEDSTTEAEARTRFTASVISGGMMIVGDDLTKPEARARVAATFGNQEMLDLAKQTPHFWPVSGTTGSKAGDTFVWRGKDATYVALFNFSKTETRAASVPFSRLGITGHFRLHDLWTKRDGEVETILTANVPPMDCALFRLRPSSR